MTPAEMLAELEHRLANGGPVILRLRRPVRTVSEVSEPEVIIAHRLRAAIRRLYATSQRAPDVRHVPMLLVRQDAFEELLALAREVRP